ncbi:MAG: type I DNA topoisomerase [Spirochaetes bacterium]|nr:type I DNA topoisomerase [Spirochaetota bacterium]
MESEALEKNEAKKPAAAKRAPKDNNSANRIRKGQQRKLIIVESPAKAKTINRYLGNDYYVTSSMGHLIDLPKSRMAIDFEHDFEPEYITIRGRAKVLNELKKQAKNATEILLASDDDREGESIAWHIGNQMNKATKGTVPIKRIVFEEITKDALIEAVKHPRDIDVNKVNAQKARRVLDRIVGYNLSPLLWEKVKKGLSAGRVQSVALRFIVEREDEILEFIPDEYWTLDAEVKHKQKNFFIAMTKFKGDKVDLKTKEATDAVMAELADKDFIVENIELKEKMRNPSPPFTTSKLQQAASGALGYNAPKTMQVAQGLYEGVEINGAPVGLITYMRTDSVRVSEYAQAQARDFILKAYGQDYLPPAPPVYAVKKNAQDAHEAIRPTDVNMTPDSIKEFLARDQFRLYKLIWERFISSQMPPARFETKRIIIRAGEGEFTASSSKPVFDGYLKPLSIVEDDEKESRIPHVTVGEKLALERLVPEQHFTMPPPRYTDATLVKVLEESGIGRPSTYAPTIKTIIGRHYVVRKGKQLVPTEIGKLVNELITKNFPKLVDANFTADMEAKLDKVEDASIEWHSLLSSFYPDFKQTLEIASENIKNMKNFFDEKTDLVCEKCGKPMIKRLGRYGYFLACSGFPDCRNAKSIPLGTCPKCGGVITLKRSKRGREFYGCSKYPNCDFVTWDKPSPTPCPKCGKMLVEKSVKVSGSMTLTCIDEACGYTQAIDENGEPKAAAVADTTPL